MPLQEYVTAKKSRSGKQVAQTVFDDDAYPEEEIAQVTCR
jgi:hypothetical protein